METFSKFQTRTKGTLKHSLTDLVWDLFGPAFRLIFCSANFLLWNIISAILDQGLLADVGGNVVGDVHHLNVANFTENFITFLLLSTFTFYYSQFHDHQDYK